MTTSDGLVTIHNLNYEFKDEYINVYNFQTMRDPRMLRFEQQDIAVESKIRLEKEDVKNILDRKMNKNIGVYQSNIRVPQQQQQQQRPQVQHQNVILPKRPSSVPLPQPQPQLRPQPQPPMRPHPHHPPQQIRKNNYRGIGMGGIN
jgi:hypothetical protein